MNKKKHLLILVLLSIGAFAFLFTRPKSVVKDIDQTVQQNQKEPSSKEVAHHLSPESEALLESLQQKAQSPKGQLEAFSEIANLYIKESVFDSAGYYFEKIAKTTPSVNNWSNAADAYFQGFNLAISPENLEKLVEKTRACYNEVLKLEAGNLHAKTNLAMSYVGSDNPMKAIGMLREVLDQEPKYIPAIMSLGGLSMQSNQYDKAAVRFSNVLQIDPNNVNAKLGLAYSYIELGKKDEAKAILNQVIALDIDQVMKDEIAKTLNSLK
ncbi:lipopolysaccharide assembly protein LapB [Lacihabitans sp. LS3-19]|uniref:tetratricopeptide repeat protein n=1 Tax=Lacihabitans sp. LS3-19 TaxID=2487335 RepID=UPI0020CF1B6B|nr:tetratricopeptide repeat protein [Lacihabitans sp. LS3-19]